MPGIHGSLSTTGGRYEPTGPGESRQRKTQDSILPSFARAGFGIRTVGRRITLYGKRLGCGEGKGGQVAGPSMRDYNKSVFAAV
jgi:hypothetical protein